MEKTLKARERKLLGAVSEANKAGYEFSHDGLLAFLKGEIKEDWAKELPFYGCLLSLGGRQGKSAIRTLLQYGYLRQRYDDRYDLYFLYLSEKGEMEVPLPPKKKTISKPDKPLFIKRR